MYNESLFNDIFVINKLALRMELFTIKTFKKILSLILVDILIIWVWEKNEDLGPGSAMVIYLVVPFAFIINIIIGGILFFTKRSYSIMFFVNCIVAPIITYWMFTTELSNQSRSAYDTWDFNLKDTTFRIDKSNNYTEFSMSYSNFGGSSIQFLSGEYIQSEDTLILKVDSSEMYIYKNKLYNFRHSKLPIPLKLYD